MSLNVKTGISGFHDLCLLAKCRGKNIMQRLLATTGRHLWAHQRVLLPTYSVLIARSLSQPKRSYSRDHFSSSVSNTYGGILDWTSNGKIFRMSFFAKTLEIVWPMGLEHVDFCCVWDPLFLLGTKNAIPHPLNPCFERIFCCTWVSIPCSCLKMNPWYPKATGMVDILILLKK